MLDFSKINAFENGQRESFESLVRILASREKPIDGVEFQPNDGRGGDGGVEALWITSDKRKIGYQAKYVDSLGESQLRQMGESIDRAIATHPELKKYVFAIPFDLTPNRGPRARGSQQEKWDKRVAKWKELADKKGIDIEIVLWTKTIITDMLFQNENFELRRHWFEEEILDDDWFRSQINSATLSLNDRFNPEDHVDVTIEALFDAIVRGPSILRQISSGFEKLDKAQIPSIEFETIENAPDKDTLREAKEARHDLLQLAGSFEEDISSPWPVREALERLSVLQKVVSKLERPYLSVEQEPIEKTEQLKLYSIKNDLDKISLACYDLEETLNSHYIFAEEKQCSLVYGPAGAGKSHLLARVAEERTKLGMPTALLLGQDYSESQFWHRTGELLGLKGRTPEDILGVLNAVGLRKKKRVLLLFDAINECVVDNYWRSKISSIIKRLKKYSHVTAVFSCREEYLPYTVPNDLMESLPRYYVSGFSSPEEREQAAIRYLDYKGIARPNTPWLAPEFSNPLLLKCVSEALSAKGESEFPKGLRGISKIMSLYLDALCWRVETASVNADSISDTIKRTAQKIASRMAKKGSDFLTETDATRCVNTCFLGRAQPEGKTWLQVLCEASLFRIDVPPFPKDHNPMIPPPRRVRFAFQRFQDHLMAVALTKKVRQGHEIEAYVNGSLSFLLVDGHSGKELNYQFAGLMNALSITFPEELGVEFVMTLPEWQRIWKNAEIVQNSFAESFKWRREDAFSKQTSYLLGNLDGNHVDVPGLLLEVSMSVDHPHNALQLHKRLKQWSLPKRDSMWTRWINNDSRYEHSQIERIVSWALALLDRPADTQHLKLASIILAWCLSSSYMTLRDRATKALSIIFLVDSSIFEFVARLTHDCDDPYVIERLYASAFGACCLDPEPDRLSSYSRLIYDLVFSDGEPPVGLLARDYALGVIELAKTKGSLSKEISLRDCHHPFSSTPPNFGLTKGKVEGIAKKSGGKQIFISIIGGIADYGTYTIPGRVQNFLATPLCEPKPYTKEELKARFFAEVIDPFPERVEALDDLEKYLKCQRPILIIRYEQEHLDDDTRKLINRRAQEQKRVRKALEQYLSEDEKKRLSSEYLGEGRTRENENRVNLEQCKLWVIKRAYDLGWTSDLFPKDYEGSSLSSSHNDLERIGKKYQRIALDELQARLADNFWMIQGSPEEVTTYRYYRHNSFRNIEPTILPTVSRYGDSVGDKSDWITQPRINLPPMHEKDLKHWPFQSDPVTSVKSKIFRTSQTGQKWLVLYEFNLGSEKYNDSVSGEHGLRYQEFRFIYCVLLRQGESAKFVKYLKRKKDLDVGWFSPVEFTDGPFLLEAHWRDTWREQKFSDRMWSNSENFEFAIPVADYHWERHLDKTLPNGFSSYLPQKWFADELRLNMVDASARSWKDSKNHTVLISATESENRSAIVIDEKTFLNYANESNLKPVWIMISERSAWLKGNDGNFSKRRSEAVAWKDGEKWKHHRWKKDSKR